ncbi:MAG: 30S ribosomal protein S6 [Chloroflexi bacterium]|nr:30S ribosomal protein S6 [Chloroflexota bacterium]
MTTYNLTFVMTPTVPEEEMPAALENVRRLVTDRGGTIESEEVWGRRRLAYPVRHQREGTYVVSRISLSPEKAHELEASLRLHEQVLRHIVTRAGK